ncbi:predicted protein [Sclerotinia sclerotiorum 1980 UF-70]|uniref:Uncharacterized protein n=1 Tax=Sclerotinia sclerotiorum (strain ATCC 18683 / 1980 / Ss-1) TaxID=665079 RepID=A7E5L1_SCLS1|nr:predicted protein [Sclerotinia sclerotiorum 1980 UF-70]EDN91183.1 predicted protein [Sclerotinia sclerotiorum 1980 UF-70]
MKEDAVEEVGQDDSDSDNADTEALTRRMKHEEKQLLFLFLLAIVSNGMFHRRSLAMLRCKGVFPRSISRLW